MRTIITDHADQDMTRKRKPVADLRSDITQIQRGLEKKLKKGKKEELQQVEHGGERAKQLRNGEHETSTSDLIS